MFVLYINNYYLPGTLQGTLEIELQFVNSTDCCDMHDVVSKYKYQDCQLLECQLRMTVLRELWFYAVYKLRSAVCAPLSKSALGLSVATVVRFVKFITTTVHTAQLSLQIAMRNL